QAFFGGTATSTFSSAGFLGIGSTTPWGQLSVNPSNLAAGVPEFVVGSSTQTDFVITQAHNVGVGTTNPGALFTVNGTASTTNLTISALGPSAGSCLTTTAAGALTTTSCTGTGAQTNAVNSWTALQKFNANASSTQFSATQA